MLTPIMALIAATRRLGWCLINSSIAVPRLLAVSPNASELFRFLMAGKYSGERSTYNNNTTGRNFQYELQRLL